LENSSTDRNEEAVQPTPSAFQPQPFPVAPPPTIPDEYYDRVEGDEVPIDWDRERSSRRRALFARVVGVLLILMTAALAFVTVGRAWVRSLPSDVWPASLLRREQPVLPTPLRPEDEPVAPSAPAEPPVLPPMQTLPTARATAAPEETTVPMDTGARAPAEVLPPRQPAPAVEEPRSRPRRPVQKETSEAVPAPADPTPPVEAAPPDQGMTPEELPARPSVDPSSPESPPAGEALSVPENEARTLFGDE
jgi:hypothetical protein